MRMCGKVWVLGNNFIAHAGTMIPFFILHEQGHKLDEFSGASDVTRKALFCFLLRLVEPFVEIVENALALFISKTKGADEALLLRELASSEEHRDLLEALVAKADYMEFCSAMRGHRRRELQKQFDGMLLGSGADKK